MSKLRHKAFVLVAILLVMGLAACSRNADPIPAASSRSGGATAAAATPGSETAVATGLPNVGSLPEPTPPPQVYIVQAGDTLSRIASYFGCDLEALIETNNISDPNALQVGQKLTIPTTEIETGPAIRLLPDSEFVNGPAYVDFDVGSFCAEQGGYLTEYYENIRGAVLSGPEIVELVARHYSVGPRMLLAVLELQSGWVTDPNPAGQALSYPLGYTGSGWENLSRQLAWASNELNQGYYDWRGRGVTFVAWGDGTATRYAPTLNAATVGLQRFFSLRAKKHRWEALVGSGPESFLVTYRRLFGDSAQYAIEPLVPADAIGPPLALPWPEGELWFYTGGPHGGWGDGSAWAALDFVPDEGYLGCQAATSWATAAAPGLVIYSQDGEVVIDLDGDGREETGWVLLYLHVATEGRVPVGVRVERGDRIGHPSCEGGFAESTHLHIARKYNGEWIAADGPLPLLLSGWRAYSTGREYEGTLVRSGEERTACECRDAEFNGLVAGE